MTTANAPTAESIMNRHVFTVEENLTLAEVTSFLLKHKISNAPVVKHDNGKKCLLGLISEGDCLEFMANEFFYGNPSQPQTAATIMKRHLVCVSPDEDVFTIASILTSHGYRHIPVVRDHELLGIVSRRDILTTLEKFYREWIDARDRERFPVDLHQIMNLRFLASRRD